MYTVLLCRKEIGTEKIAVITNSYLYLIEATQILPLFKWFTISSNYSSIFYQYNYQHIHPLFLYFPLDNLNQFWNIIYL